MKKRANVKQEQKQRSEWFAVFGTTKVVVVISTITCLFLFLLSSAIFHLITYFLENIRTGSSYKNAVSSLFDFNFPRFWWMYILFFIVGVLVALSTAYSLKQSYGSLKTQKYSRELTTIAELENDYIKTPHKDTFFEGAGGVVISHYKKSHYIERGDSHTGVIGALRSGKGEMIVVPTIDNISRAKKQIDRGSMIIGDPKGELYIMSRETLKKRGYNVMHLDLVNFAGAGYNLLHQVKVAVARGDMASAEVLTNHISTELTSQVNDDVKTDPKWDSWAKGLMNGIILSIAIDILEEIDMGYVGDVEELYKKINITSVISLAQEFVYNENLIDSFFKTRPKTDTARVLASAFLSAPTRQRGGIMSTMLDTLLLFTFDGIKKMTLETDQNLDFEAFGFDIERPTAIFIKTSASDRAYHFIFRIFIEQLYYTISKKAENSLTGKTPRTVWFLIDEAGTLPPIPSLSSKLTYSAGLNIRFLLVFHSFSQISEKYGINSVESIINGLTNIIFLLSPDEKTAEKMSDTIGTRTVEMQSRHGDPLKLDKHITTSVEDVPIFKATQLMELLPGESVVHRPLHRHDTKGRGVKAKPIFNSGKTAMPYRFTFLSDTFPDRVDVLRKNPHFFGEPVFSEYDLKDYTYKPLEFFSGGIEENELIAEMFAIKEIKEEGILLDLLDEQTKKKIIMLFTGIDLIDYIEPFFNMTKEQGFVFLADKNKENVFPNSLAKDVAKTIHEWELMRDEQEQAFSEN